MSGKPTTGCPVLSSRGSLGDCFYAGWAEAPVAKDCTRVYEPGFGTSDIWQDTLLQINLCFNLDSMKHSTTQSQEPYVSLNDFWGEKKKNPKTKKNELTRFLRELSSTKHQLHNYSTVSKNRRSNSITFLRSLLGCEYVTFFVSE